MSTFHGLEVAKRGLFAQQSALHTTGHNIANANTEGYTRQRVNFEQTAPFPPASRNRPNMPGQIGSGVQPGSIERVREQFLDLQYRGEANKTAYWETLAGSISNMEEVMNEPSEQGLAKTMDRFWESLQDLATNPEDAGARSVVRQRGIAVAETFNHLSGSLKGIQKDLENEMNVTIKDINSSLKQIGQLNRQIGDVEPHGYVPNDLYDERDRLIDDLSQMIDIEVKYESGQGSPKAAAMGQATVFLVNGDERETLVKGGSNEESLSTPQFEATFEEVGGRKVVTGISLVPSANEKEGADFLSQGRLLALKEAHGYQDSAGGTKGMLHGMSEDLDKMAFAFANRFNEVHEDGATLKDIEEKTNGADKAFRSQPFFILSTQNLTEDEDGFNGAAGSLNVHQAIKDDTDNIAAASRLQPFGGDGTNALAMAEVKDEVLPDLGKAVSLKSFYEGVIGKMGVEAQEYQRMTDNSTILKESVEQRRQSVSAVSLDEEMTNMIKYQHAYNASARNMTAVDEMLDRIINQMGLVGR
ncbi:flagellar hook-associated protein 1 [Thalassobacillus devorans]|uniref:Flagellar hook-associated protein 1 n=1 Tax=Thalassobacillus devorans TaxID=279813 RepID=A0ABQ1NYA1_9BACI|nr:flagellar hook-associated protein FlgK [Thalassobacillus devorans]NIK28861.1 flagellar hook-associated protein 1 FlgK [Thalassobacillus devorans]GGC83025.1 flagellar hook-associated protein 1 [Thalassobacillus devorans]